MNNAIEERYSCYMFKYHCPRCGSLRTGTNVIATSSRWMRFVCHICLKTFRKSARNTSSLSATLSQLSKEL